MAGGWNNVVVNVIGQFRYELFFNVPFEYFSHRVGSFHQATWHQTWRRSTSSNLLNTIDPDSILFNSHSICWMAYFNFQQHDTLFNICWAHLLLNKKNVELCIIGLILLFNNSLVCQNKHGLVHVAPYLKQQNCYDYCKLSCICWTILVRFELKIEGGEGGAYQPDHLFWELMNAW